MSNITTEEVLNDIPVTTNNNVSNIDVIWPATDTLTHFNNEGSLPVIGSCQVSSILSTLETVPKDPQPLPEPSSDTFKSIAFNVCDETDHKRNKKKKDVILLEKKQLYQEMVFFGCNFCPFICTKDSKISDHINTVHKNQEDNHRTKLKCPGCTNVFYHTLSLRSHLIHDHEVCKADISKIVNGIVYVSNLTNETAKKHENGRKITPHFLVNDHISSEDDANDVEDLPEAVLPNNMVITEMLNEKNENNATTIVDIQPENEITDNSLLNDVVNSNNIDVPPLETAPMVVKTQNASTEEKKIQKCVIPTCTVRMRDITNMAYHVRSHYGKIFNCLECNEKFPVWKTLQTHLWRYHKTDMELYSCDKCEYKTYSLAKLNNVHKLIHGDEKPFLCDFCGKGFKNPKQLRNHKIVHKTKPLEQQHECEICKRMFGDKRQLRVHMNSVHQKIKPFSCSYCGYKAASNAALRLHVRQHTGEKPFACDLCDYTTSDHNSLRRHKSRHSGIKKYKCAHCDYACIQSTTYKTHLKTRHPGLENGLMFSCPNCNFRTINKDKYMIHTATHKEKTIKKTEIKKTTNNKTIANTDLTNLGTDCIILPLEGDINATNVVPNDVQYIYSGTGVVVEVTKEKTQQNDV